MSVKNNHAKYEKLKPKWKRIRDVIAGQDEVHAAGSLYLPKLAEQEDAAYKAYVARTPFVNYTWRTVAAMKGMLFRKPMTLEVPAGMKAYLDDVTQSGVPFSVFAEQIALEIIEVDRVGILVDHPPRPEGSITVAQAEALGLRPTMKKYDAEHITNWEYRRINNKTVLSQVRLTETKITKESEFVSKEEPVWRVLDLDENDEYRVRVFNSSEVVIEGPTWPMMNGKRLKEIPFYVVATDGLNGEPDVPSITDLVDLNLKHYTVSADYEHGCHWTGIPTFYITGWEYQTDPETGNRLEPKIYMGAETALLLTNPEATVGYAQAEDNLTSLKENLDRKEAQIAALGARMLAPEKSGVEAAETLSIRNSGEGAVLSATSIATSLGLKRALETFRNWAGVSGEIKCELNRNFMPKGMDPAKFSAYSNAVVNGTMSQETFFEILQSHEELNPELTFEMEQARIDEGMMRSAERVLSDPIDERNPDNVLPKPDKEKEPA